MLHRAQTATELWRLFGLFTLQGKQELNIETYFYYVNKEELLYLLTVAKLNN